MSFFIETQLVFNRKRSRRSARPKCYFPKFSIDASIKRTLLQLSNNKSYKKRDGQKMRYF